MDASAIGSRRRKSAATCAIAGSDCTGFDNQTVRVGICHSEIDNRIREWNVVPSTQD